MPLYLLSCTVNTEPRMSGGGTSKNEHEETKEGPTWGGLLFNVNLMLNAAYLIGTLALSRVSSVPC